MATSVVISLQIAVLYLDAGSRGLVLSFFYPFSDGADPESVPVSGEHCKHPGLGPGPSRAHEAPRFNPSRHIPSKAATIASLSARD